MSLRWEYVEDTDGEMDDFYYVDFKLHGKKVLTVEVSESGQDLWSWRIHVSEDADEQEERGEGCHTRSEAAAEALDAACVLINSLLMKLRTAAKEEAAKS